MSFIIITEGNLLSPDSFLQPGGHSTLLSVGTSSSERISLGDTLFEGMFCQFPVLVLWHFPYCHVNNCLNFAKV